MINVASRDTQAPTDFLYTGCALHSLPGEDKPITELFVNNNRIFFSERTITQNTIPGS